MSNEYTFFTDQTALTFRICLVYPVHRLIHIRFKIVMAMHPAEPPLIRNPNAASLLNIFFWKGREVNVGVCKLV